MHAVHNPKFKGGSTYLAEKNKNKNSTVLSTFWYCFFALLGGQLPPCPCAVYGPDMYKPSIEIDSRTAFIQFFSRSILNNCKLSLIVFIVFRYCQHIFPFIINSFKYCEDIIYFSLLVISFHLNKPYIYLSMNHGRTS